MSISNGIDATVAQRWMKEGLKVYDDLEALKIDNMNRAKVIRARLPGIYESAKNAGLPIRAFKQSLKKVLLERKIEGLEDDIESLVPEDEDDAAAYEMLQAALGSFGDTPLGAATLEKAADKRDKAEAKKTARKSDAEPVNDQSAQVEANTKALEEGIKPLAPKEPFEDDATAAKPSRAQQRADKLKDLH